MLKVHNCKYNKKNRHVKIFNFPTNFDFQGGMYVLQLMDHYSAGFCVLIIAIVECLVINWIYGQYWTDFTLSSITAFLNMDQSSVMFCNLIHLISLSFISILNLRYNCLMKDNKSAYYLILSIDIKQVI